MPYWILDINQEVVDRGSGKAQEIWLWCIDGEGRRVRLIDRGFRPEAYVYSGRVDVDSLKRRVEEAVGALVEKVEVSEALRFGRRLKVVRLVFKHSEARERAEKILERMGLELYNFDVRTSFLYFIHRGIPPSSWIEADGLTEFKAPETPIPTYIVENVRASNEGRPPPLKTLYLCAYAFTEVGTPDPRKAPLSLVAYAVDDGPVSIMVGDGGDEGLLRGVVEVVREVDPDLIVTWGGNRDMWDYMVRRAEALKVDFGIGRDGRKPRRGVYGHYSIVGRIHVDVMDIALEMATLKAKTLEEMASYHGVWSGDVLDDYDLSGMWFSSRDPVINYVKRRVEALRRLWGLYLDYAVKLSNTVFYPMDYVLTASPGNRVDGYVVLHAIRRGELVPPRGREVMETYRGGLVFEPRPGLHENVVVLDFASMYPHIIVKYNVSPDTLVEDECGEDECFKAPRVHHKFRKRPDGLYKLAVKRLLEERKRLKELIKSIPRDSPVRRALSAQEKAIKIVANAMYGYLGWTASRWYKREIAESITAWGRDTILRSARMAEELGLTLIYGDTDSLFVKYEPGLVEALIERIERELGMDIKVDEEYVRVLFTEAKKRYAGLTRDGRIDVVGLEAVRGDWCRYAKRAQEAVLDALLRSGDKKKALEVARDIVRRFRAGKYTVEDLVIWKSVDKPLKEYKARTPHVAVARRLVEKGWKIRVGDRIGYVVLKGYGPLYERVEYYKWVRKDQVDKEYYLRKQIVPAMVRVLSPLGISDVEILAGGGVGLERWF